MYKIGAILVLYRPDIELTLKVIKSLAIQVDSLCIVDNTPNENNSNHFTDYNNIHYIPLLKNQGIAAAQNIGIKYFSNTGFDFVIFSDQDSIAPDNTVSGLVETYIKLEKAGIKIGAIGPQPILRGSSRSALERQNIRKYEEFTNIGKPLYFMYSVISSFSVIRLERFNKVGMFDESLFIDGVDSEWGWRAYGLHEYVSVLDPSIKISHCFGERNQGPLEIFVPSPFRTYYQFRNYFKLIRRKYTPKWWIVKNGIKYLIKFIYYPLFLNPRFDYLKNMARGIRDGILNK